MNKAELIEHIANKAKTNKKQANQVIDSFTEAVVETLKTGDRVTIVGFGSFSVKERAARNGRNPLTGTSLKLKAKKVPKFKAGKEFAEALNKKK
jgi:DNA-binding protein HU-beta